MSSQANIRPTRGCIVCGVSIDITKLRCHDCIEQRYAEDTGTETVVRIGKNGPVELVGLLEILADLDGILEQIASRSGDEVFIADGQPVIAVETLNRLIAEARELNRK